MTKEQFIIELRKRLSLLESEEVDNIVEEYLDYIKQKLNEGLTEEEALEKIGNVNDIAEKILRAHKIAERYIKIFIGKEKVIDEINDFITKITEVSTTVFSKIESSVTEFARNTGHFAKNVYQESKKFGEEKIKEVKNIFKKESNDENPKE